MNEMTVAELITLLEAHCESEWIVDVENLSDPYDAKEATGIDIDTGDQVVTIACSNPQFPAQTLRTNRLKNELAKYSTGELQAIVADRLKELRRFEEERTAHIPTLEQVTNIALGVDDNDVGFDEHDHGAH